MATVMREAAAAPPVARYMEVRAQTELLCEPLATEDFVVQSMEDVSPATLLAETFADRLRLSTQEQGKAIALSGKARSAIPLAGRLGQQHPQGKADEAPGRLTRTLAPGGFEMLAGISPKPGARARGR